jgi:DNA-binding PadR family transcriptional regulator
MRLAHQKLLAGFIRLHVLHHAAKGEVYGNWMIEELAHHGYKVSAGTLYPLLHGMERDGYLVSAERQDEGRIRRVYRATRTGVKALEAAKVRLRELFKELIEDERS